MEKFVMQWKETFPVNVPQLVSTEQNTIREGECEQFEKVCQEQFFKKPFMFFENPWKC